ncbi:39S ribosomal protein L53/MRP-L53-domain-containing protein [Coniella lustricola]|uniref:Large ribosomal subunit protein mL53 n=1 Tax=Coniella lustricola TaxID=2025994 RepID=A0A2T3AMF0_9PEZI|nr:39S ribosomal protein L53/MRP-L53-domain-containing protein [Coniella lustricola]
MITRFITEVTTKINPFSPKAKSARLFLTVLPPTARNQGMTITTKLLSQSAAEKTSLQVKFKDGKLLDLDCENMGIKNLIEECDRHSRVLQKQAALADS